MPPPICNDCDAPTSLGAIAKVTTIEGIGEVGRLYFQRKFKVVLGVTSLNEMTPATAALLATWSGLFGASDDTTVVASPVVHAPAFEGGEKLEHGGVGVRQGGRTQKQGRGTTRLKIELLDIPAVTERELRALECETDLVVFFIDECKNIWGTNEEDAQTKFYGFDIEASFTLSGRIPQGKGVPDKHELEIELSYGWSNNADKIEPSDFNPYTDLPV